MSEFDSVIRGGTLADYEVVRTRAAGPLLRQERSLGVKCLNFSPPASAATPNRYLPHQRLPQRIDSSRCLSLANYAITSRLLMRRPPAADPPMGHP